MADTDVLIKDLPLTETVNDSDDLVTEDSSPTTHRIKASVVKNYINSEQNEELEGFKADLDNTNANIGSLSSKVDDATTTVSSMQTNLNSMDGRVQANADGISELNSALADTESSLNTKISAKQNVLSTQYFSVDNITIEAVGSGNSYVSGTLSCSRSGYTPIGIVGFRLNNASSSGTGNSTCWINRSYLSGTTINYQIGTRSTSDVKVLVGFYVLYYAN